MHAARVEEQPPENRDDRGREDPRKDVDGPEDRPWQTADGLRVEHDGEQHPDHHVHDHAGDSEDQGVERRIPEGWLREDGQVVRDPDEVGGLVGDDVVHQRVADDDADRDHHETDDQNHGRADQQVRFEPMREGRAMAVPRPGRRGRRRAHCSVEEVMCPFPVEADCVGGGRCAAGPLVALQWPQSRTVPSTGFGRS